MKILSLVCLLILIFACEGDIGPMGPNGARGLNGDSTIIATAVCEFIPVGNPYTEIIGIDLAKFKAGDQIIQVYVYRSTNEWMELPSTYEIAGIQYNDQVYIGDGYITLETFTNGVPFGGDACLGSICMVIIIDLN